jgi:hypothetical protein
VGPAWQMQPSAGTVASTYVLDFWAFATETRGLAIGLASDVLTALLVPPRVRLFDTDWHRTARAFIEREVPSALADSHWYLTLRHSIADTRASGGSQSRRC